ncbi:uncharacterized protein LOC122371575 [Amphibalanus amphitrite]|uniref:uncharacterized protein LOC122371575 n=1 Tax=Amphibalanus amphitrite TaxID=1232801 RepID=UPI001C929C7E|nr:uncharacterized protein LOC122371575 [Amphibalanus amphitrite]
MLRRELIMVEPYRQLRYHGHRSRVASASAVVDAGPPTRPRHVVEPGRRQAARRQLQWRHLDADIRLMRALAEIMDSKRLDNDNTDFEKYRRLLQGSRTRSVDRSTPLPPPPDPYPATDDTGKPLRLCQTLAPRPRSLSSPAPSPLDQWPDTWLLEYRHQKQQLLQQREQQRRQQAKRRRPRRRHRSAQPGTAGREAPSSERQHSRPRPVTSVQLTKTKPSSEAWDGDETEGDAEESDGDADAESAASGADNRYLGLRGGEVGFGGIFGGLPDPDARDRLRKHGMVLMKGMIGCRCAARQAT